METKPPLLPKTLETALMKVQAVEDAWNTRDLERVAAVVLTCTHLSIRGYLINDLLFHP